MADPLIGPHRTGPLTLYHGMSANTEAGAIRTALDIIQSGALYPGRDSKDTDPTQWVFQEIIPDLMGPVSEVNVLQYLQDPRNQDLHDRVNSRFPVSHMIPMNLRLDNVMSGDFRSRTTCFTEEKDSRYHNFLAFEFDLTEGQISEIEKANFSGKAFFGKLHVRCTGDLPLTYCSRILIGPYIQNPTSVKAGLEKSLAAQNLRHVEVITPQSRESNNRLLLPSSLVIVLILALGALLQSLLPEHPL